MSIEKTWQTESFSSEQTEQFAEKLGAKLRGGEVIELVSDLGGGKTTFTRGLVRGAGSTDRVASPTFTISREYTAPSFTFMHVDLYRLQEAGLMGNELAEVFGDNDYVSVVEWGDVVQDVLPKKRITIRIIYTGETSRSLRVLCPEAYAYLLTDVL